MPSLWQRWRRGGKRLEHDDREAGLARLDAEVELIRESERREDEKRRREGKRQRRKGA